MSAEDWTIFGQYPAPVKLGKAPQVIENYLSNQNIFVENEKTKLYYPFIKGPLILKKNQEAEFR